MYTYKRAKELDEEDGLIAYTCNKLNGKLLCNSIDRFPDKTVIDEDSFEMNAYVSGDAHVSGDARVWYNASSGEYNQRKDVRGSDWDMCLYPMSCKGLNLHIDDRHAVQMLFHLMSCLKASPELMQDKMWAKMYDDMLEKANTFHRKDVPRLEELKDIAEMSV